MRLIITTLLSILSIGCRFKPAVYPGYENQNIKFGLIGSSSYIGQQHIYSIQAINGLSPRQGLPHSPLGIMVPPGRYTVIYKWGYWGDIKNKKNSVTVDVEAGFCYQPWVIETVSKKRDGMICPGGTENLSLEHKEKICRPAFVKIRKTSLVMKSFLPEDDPQSSLCSSLLKNQ